MQTDPADANESTSDIICSESLGADDYDKLSDLGRRQSVRLGQYFAGRGIQPLPRASEETPPAVHLHAARVVLEALALPCRDDVHAQARWRPLGERAAGLNDGLVLG